jgi:hypothetical protein
MAAQTSPDVYSLTPFEVEYLKNKLHSPLILPSEDIQNQDNEVRAKMVVRSFDLFLMYCMQKVYFGRQGGNHVRLRAMLIKGESRAERTQSIYVSGSPFYLCYSHRLRSQIILSKIKCWRHLRAPNLISISGFVTSSEEPLLKVVSFCPSTTIMGYLKTHPDHNKLACVCHIKRLFSKHYNDLLYSVCGYS